jgi:hypothetical protein
MVKAILILFLCLGVASGGIIGCSSPGTVRVTSSTKTNAPTISTLVNVRNQVIENGKSLDITSGGITVKADHTLTLSWSADGNLECHILTASEYTQYLAFKQSGKQSGIPSSQAARGTITESVRNDDTFHAILINGSISELSVKLYQATLTEQ